MKVAGIITARGGSKRFPGKNMAPLMGKPLIAYTMEASLNCKLIDQTWLTTDCDDIIDLANQYSIKSIKRPEHLARDNSTSYETVVHALQTISELKYEFDYFVLLQPTSPLRNSSHLEEAIQLVGDSGAKSVVSVCLAEHSPYKSFVKEGKFLKPLFDEKRINLPAQSLPDVYRQNGAIYVIPTKEFLNGQENFFVEPVVPYRMSTLDSMDVDTELDLKIVETLLKSD